VSYLPRYDKGDWLTICDVCGRKYKATNLKKRWDGLMCCDDDWEIRQPQDFVRGQADTQIAPWLRSEPSNSFIPFNFTEFLTATPQGSTSSLTTLTVAKVTFNQELNAEAINVKTIG
jgi:hypothetical protein